MKHNKIRLSRLTTGRSRQSGIALITTLLLLLLMTALSLAMVISVRSDLLVNGYYRNARGSFYAADSGINIARQYMINGVTGSIPATVAPATAPLPPGTDAAVLTALQAKFNAAPTPIAGSGVSGATASSWPERFQITKSTLVGTCTTDDGSPCTAPSVKVKSFTYNFNYTLTSIGQSGANFGAGQSAELTESGKFGFVATLTPATAKTAFSAWGMFIDQFPICSGTLVQGTITGPVFTNGAWTFGTGTTGYTFTDPVGSASPNFGYQFGSCLQSPNPTDTSGASTIAPKFQAGYNLGQPAVPLPSDSFDQARAVLDGIGKPVTPPAAPTPTEKSLVLNNANGGAAYPSGGASTGVFLPYSTTSGVNTFTGGGIYVEGNANITLSTSGTAGQVYNINQSGVTTVITVDPTVGPNGTTTVVAGGKTTIINGVPMQRDPLLPPTDQTMLYVNGSVTGLTGTHDSSGNSLPAINDNSSVTISALSNVTITGDIKYKTEPVTTSATQIAGLGADALIPGNDHQQVLGIFTAGGDIQLNNSQPPIGGKANTNLEIDGSLATLSSGGTGGIVNTGAAITNLNIVGGRIQNSIKNINATTRNVFFDRRFSTSFSPPWFPSTTVTSTKATAATPSPTLVLRTQWQNKTSTY